MRRMIVRLGATGAGVLIALGLFAGPSAGANGPDKPSKAEPSRTERSNTVTCFQPEGRTQGRSLSDPDGDSNGGADKPDPDCTGGVDINDRDGNNGCGNDVDREDDNNGNCGRGPDQGPGDEPALPEDGTNVPVPVEPVRADVNVQAAGSESESGVSAAEASGPTTTTAEPATSAAGDTTSAADSTTPEPATEVLGETLSAPDTLARTGVGLGGLALLGALLVGGGRLTVLARKLLRTG